MMDLLICILLEFEKKTKKNQLYCGGQFYCWRKSEYQEKTINLPQVTENHTT